MRSTPWKIIQAVVLIAILVSTGRLLWKASQPRILADSRQFGGLFTRSPDGDPSAGGFTVNRWEFRRWFREHEFVALTGCVVAAQPLAGLEQGVRINSDASVIWYASVQTEGSEPGSTKTRIEVSIEYDMIRETATLLNTGEQFQFSPEKVYTVFVDEQFGIKRFVALDPTEKAQDLPPKLTENFSTVTARRQAIHDPVKQ